MAKIPFKISSILNGLSVSDYFSAAGQYLHSIGIDPDMPASDSGRKPSGYIRPTSMEKFSASVVDGIPLFIITNPKTSTLYVILENGDIVSYDSSLSSETLIGTVTGAAARGAAYYDNYLYISRTADIARYGPLNGSPSLTQAYWTGTLSLTALVNTTYPSINGLAIPNHQLHRHTDNRLYICGVLSSNKGSLHYIETTKTTVEGDTNDGSDHDKLDFGYGEYPIQCETYQTDLAVILIEGINTSMMRGRLSFWDTTSASFTLITSVETNNEQEIFTALKNVNGILYVFSGFLTGGCRVSRVISGYQLEEVAYLPEEYPPVSGGAVDHIINRFAWGSNTIQPEAAGAVFAIGAKEEKLPMGLQAILRAPSTGANPIVTAVKYVQSNGKIRQPIIGYKADGSEYGLAKISTTYGNYNVIRMEMIVPDQYNGKNFQLKYLRIPFAQAIAANMTLKVYIYGDDGSTTPSANDRTLTTITNTAPYSGKRYVEITPNTYFTNNFYIEFHWEGTALLTVALPITGIIETHS